jgi:arylsulfatase A-like enzyme
MGEDKYKQWAPTRRDFLKVAGLTALQLELMYTSATATTLASTTKSKPKGMSGPNILLIVTDQERYLDKLPPGYSLPGHEQLVKLGTTFTNHQITSCVCTSVRSNIYTGQHIPQTRMFDNIGWPWMKSMSTDIPTLGHMMRDLGYYSAYQGKFHLSFDMEEHHPKGALPKLMGRKTMESYGFSDYTGIGDVIGNTLGGYLNDPWIAALSNRWLKERGQALNASGTPWFFAINFVNPHDVMYFNSDEPGKPVQEKPWGVVPIARAPEYGLYKQEWALPLPKTLKQAWDASNRPKAHFNYQEARGGLVGQFPNEDERWRKLQNYYLNCIQDVDRHVNSVIDALGALGMLENTIIVYTSDHGEFAGAHGMHGKGATAYKEQNNVPMHVVHPDVKGGRKCRSLTSHLDLVPSLISMAGGNEAKKSELLDKLRGKDFSHALNDPVGAGTHHVREAALFCFNMLGYLDPKFVLDVAKTLHEKGRKEGVADIRRRKVKPDLKSHRGALRSVFDGRYKFSRYFSPLQHNKPETIEQLAEVNDLELFDLKTDPDEVVNMAADLRKNKNLVLTMNQKLNDIIATEIGKDDGSFLGLKEDTDYAFNKVNV